MSNVGLHSNMYRLTGKYLRILNDFIAKSNTLHSSNLISGKEDVLDFFLKLRSEDNIDPNFQILSSIVERKLRAKNHKPSVFFSLVIDNLSNDNFKAAYGNLGLIIEALDNEHFSSLSVLKGG